MENYRVLEQEHEIRGVVSKILYGIKDGSIQSFVRKTIFSDYSGVNWVKVAENIKIYFPEMSKEIDNILNK